MKPRSLDPRRRSWLIAGIILCSVGIQVAFLFLVLGEPDKLSWPDPNHYYAIAKGLYEGRPYSDAANEWNIYRSPGYPFVLSLIMHVVGTGIIQIRLFCIALSVPLLVVLYRLGTIVKNERAGLITMALAAVYPLYVYTPLTLYPESVLICLFAVIGLILFHTRDNRHPALLFLLGVAISLAIMIRPTSIVWIPVSLFYLFWKNKPSVSRLATVAVTLVLIPAVCVTSWMYRNYRVHGCAVFTTAGSINLLESYNERATGKKSAIGPDAEFEKAISQAGTTGEREKMRMDKARTFIRNHPGKALKIAMMQCIDLWNPIPQTATQGGMAQSKYKIINAAAYVPVLILAIAGFVLCWKNLLARTFLLLMVLNTLLNGIVAVSVRYRTVTDFVLLLMAACALAAVLPGDVGPPHHERA